MKAKSKSFLYFLIFAFFVLPFLWCGNDKEKSAKYSDYRAYLNETKDLMIEYGKKMESTKSARDAADAITWFYDQLIDMTDRAVTLNKKYPEIDEENPPVELKPYFDSVKEETNKIMQKTAPILYKYMDDKRVTDAYKNALEKLEEKENKAKG